MTKSITILSGGMDSTTLAYQLANEGYEQIFLGFDYGQKHSKELDFAMCTALKLGYDKHLHILNIENLIPRGTSALTGGGEIPKGHYADESMKATVVPNRNALFLAIAYSWAVAHQAEMVSIGVHAGDHPIYPDCRPEFIQQFEWMENMATEGQTEKGVRLYAPWLKIDKSRIAHYGALLGVPWLDTWSCYEGGEVHCGECGTCVERIEAFEKAGISDPTVYA